MKRSIDLSGPVPDDFIWLNEPKQHRQDRGKGGENIGGLVIEVEPDTDFWQRTHYGFRRDNGHCLVTEVPGDFSMTLHCEFNYTEQYHQAGIILYIDSENWIKASIEYENDSFSRLGSVVTNRGWSDWATTDIPSDRTAMWYRLHKKGADCALETSTNGKDWVQLRVAHLHVLDVPPENAGRGSTQAGHTSSKAGLYACSPMKKSFEARFDFLSIEDCLWRQE